MAVNNIDNSFWGDSGQPANTLIALILNYHLPEQIEQVLQQGLAAFCYLQHSRQHLCTS